jgi:hypothetical protein
LLIKHRGMITTEDAREEYLTKDAGAILPMLQRLGERTVKVGFLRDLEKYKETPSVALLKHFSVLELLRRMRELRDKPSR